MSRSYLESKIKEALKHAKGNQVLARTQIAAWAQEDQRLLYALAGPHLTGIVAYNVERVASGRADKEAKAQAGKRALMMKGDEFSNEILKALTEKSGALFGLEEDVRPLKRGGVSQSHIHALKQMAAKSKIKK